MIYLNFTVPAKIIARSPYEGREVKKGSVYLTCSASGTALLSVKWFKNGIIISDINDAKYQIYKMQSQNVQPPVVNSTLQIKELIKVDNGIFECVARNDFGSDKAEFQVLVEGNCVNLLHAMYNLGQNIVDKSKRFLYGLFYS